MHHKVHSHESDVLNNVLCCMYYNLNIMLAVLSSMAFLKQKKCPFTFCCTTSARCRSGGTYVQYLNEWIKTCLCPFQHC